MENNRSSVYDIQLKARKQVLRKAYESLYSEQLEANPEAYLKLYFDDTIDTELVDHINDKKSIRKGYKRYMITVNPKPDVELDALINKIKKATKKIYIKNYQYTIEWRKLDAGMHTHIIIDMDPTREKKMSEVHREFFYTFRDLVGNKLHVNIIGTTRSTGFDDYIRGIQEGEPKSTHEVSEIMRKKFNLEQVYTNLPTCKDS